MYVPQHKFSGLTWPDAGLQYDHRCIGFCRSTFRDISPVSNIELHVLVKSKDMASVDKST